MSKRGTRLYLQDIVSSIGKIKNYTKNLSFNEFKKDEKTIDAVIRNLEIAGEAAKQLTENFKEEHASIPWSKMISMRNKVIHEYSGVDAEILWQTIGEDLPELEGLIKKLIK